MEFRLTYEGRLASGASCSARHKHDIRRQLHPQIRKVWETYPGLWEEESHRGPFDAPTEFGYRGRRGQLANFFRRGDYSFVPLIAEDMKVLCHLDILFLRPGAPGEALKSGDIDNRIKTLFDALKVPDGVPDKPSDDETPFYVLLQDDKLVTRLSVETDTLLQPTSPDAGLQDARLIITVRLTPYTDIFGAMKTYRVAD